MHGAHLLVGVVELGVFVLPLLRLLVLQPQTLGEGLDLSPHVGGRPSLPQDPVQPLYFPRGLGELSLVVVGPGHQL